MGSGKSKEVEIKTTTRVNANLKPPQVGMMSQYDQSFLPVTQISYKVNIVKGFSTIIQTTTFKNTSTEICDVGFLYPKSIHSAFSNLRIFYGDKIIEAEIMEERVAERKFNEARRKGDMAILAAGVNRQRLVDTVFTRIGNMLPNTEITTEFSIIQRVEQSPSGQWSLQIPGELRPLYPVGLSDVRNYCLEGSALFRLFRDVSKRKRGRDKGVTLNDYKLQSGDYPWNIEVSIASNNDFFYCESPTHFLIRQNDPMRGVQKYTLDPTVPQRVSKSFIFTFKDPKYKAEDLTVTKWYRNKAAPYAFNVLISPEVNLDEEGSWDSDMEDSFLDDIKAEFLFLIDRSGSMAGKKIELARESLIFFLKSLPKSSTFNVVSFGSKHQLMYKVSPLVTTENINRAITQVKKFDANFGGTELTNAFVHILKSPGSKTHPKIIFCLTDGFVKSVNEVLGVVEQNLGSSRIFTMGIGSNFSEDLVEGLAEKGEGCSSHCHDPEMMAENTIDLLDKSLEPYHILYDFNFDNSLIVDSNFKNRIKDAIKVFHGDQINLTAFLSPKVERLTHFKFQFKSKMSNEREDQAHHHNLTVPLERTINDSSLVCTKFLLLS